MENLEKKQLFEVGSHVTHRTPQFIQFKMLVMGAGLIRYIDGSSNWVYLLSWQDSNGDIRRTFVNEIELEQFKN
jgi:hypothetical protein